MEIQEKHILAPDGTKHTIFIQKAEVKSEVIQSKDKLIKKQVIPTMWQLADKYKKNGWLPKGMALSFFCPVYFAGQQYVKSLLGKRDEHDELMCFPLPPISDPRRIKVGLDHMKKLGIKNPERYLTKDRKDKTKPALATYSSLNGIEGVGGDHAYGYIGNEFVQLGAFMVVPKEHLNAGDPVNQTYRFPGEAGYSPFWRVPTFEEFKKLRPDLAKSYKQTDEGIVKVKLLKM